MKADDKDYKNAEIKWRCAIFTTDWPTPILAKLHQISVLLRAISHKTTSIRLRIWI